MKWRLYYFQVFKFSDSKSWPRWDSNPDRRNRNPLFYPLNYRADLQYHCRLLFCKGKKKALSKKHINTVFYKHFVHSHQKFLRFSDSQIFRFSDFQILRFSDLKKRLSVLTASFFYLLAFLLSWNFLYLLLNLSTRPAVSTSFILPV